MSHDTRGGNGWFLPTCLGSALIGELKQKQGKSHVKHNGIQAFPQEKAYIAIAMAFPVKVQTRATQARVAFHQEKPHFAKII
jgi:hypothetical protein